MRPSYSIKSSDKFKAGTHRHLTDINVEMNHKDVTVVVQHAYTLQMLECNAGIGAESLIR